MTSTKGIFWRFKKGPLGTAPSKWIFRDPDTHYLYSASTKEALISHIVSYREQNRLEPLDFLSATIDNYVCSLPENKGLCERFQLKRGILQYLKGGLVLARHMFTGKHVGQEEADRRSGICVGCKLNVFPKDKAGFMKWSDEIALNSVGSLKSINHDKLGSCEGCSCMLKAKCWYSSPFNLSPNESKKMRAANKNCWQLSENENKDRIDVQ